MEFDKESIRRINLSARIDLDRETWKLMSQRVVRNLEKVIDWSKASKIHTFEPIHSLYEVDITPFIVYLRKHYPLSQIYTSKQFNNVWHIVRLGENKKIEEPEIDVVIVPMLGFDAQTLNRIGYGGGYYDTFLASRTSCTKIGVCFEQGKIKSFPKEPHDVPMDYIVTDSKIYQ